MHAFQFCHIFNNKLTMTTITRQCTQDLHLYQHNGHSHTDAVAKSLSQSIIICVEHQNFSKSIPQLCQYPLS
jgi:hypothetical protein